MKIMLLKTHEVFVSSYQTETNDYSENLKIRAYNLLKVFKFNINA